MNSLHLCRRFAIATLLVAFTAPPKLASASVFDGEISSRSLVTTVQYGNACSNWQRECARYYGYGTSQWQQCMGQPKALRDCGRGEYGGEYGGGGYRNRGGYGYDGYGPSRADRCANWRRQCARLYGRETQQWYQCMGQPQAIRDCQ